MSSASAPNGEPKGKRTALWVFVGIAAVGLAAWISNAIEPTPSLRVRTQGGLFSVLEIQNAGDTTIKILDIAINDREDCTIVHPHLKAKLGTERLHKYWVSGKYQTIYSDGRITDIKGDPTFQELKVGDAEVWTTSCNVIRVWIKTDQGSATFNFQ